MAKTSLYVSFQVMNLRAEENYTYLKQVIVIAKKYNGTDAQNHLGAKNVIAQLVHDFNLLDAALKPAFASALTPEIKQLDHDRDQDYIALKEGVDMNFRMTGNDIRHNKAIALKAILNTYHTRNHLSYNEETGVIDNLLEDLDKVPVKGYLEDFNLTRVVTLLREKNNAFRAAYSQRIVQEAGKLHADIKALRAAANGEVLKFLSIIVAGVNEGDNPVFTQALEEYNVLAHAYRTLLNERKGHGNHPEEEIIPDAGI